MDIADSEAGFHHGLSSSSGTRSKVRSCFYPSERLSLERPNMIVLARCKRSNNSLAHLFCVNKGSFTPD
jgi:hypothetical protein